LERKLCDPTKLKSQIEQTPEVPGVYLFKDESGTVLYVGKAKNLRARIRSYFLSSVEHTQKTLLLVQKIVSFDILETESEVDALILESRLIKDIQPRYNIRLRDGKSYPYLIISQRVDFPIVSIAREPEFDRKHSTVFGPFTDVSALRSALQALQKAFGFRTCNIPIHEDDDSRKYFRPCILYSIDQCLAPCGLYTDKSSYQKSIRNLKKFLNGGQKSLVKQLRIEMQNAASDLEFERAALIRDQIDNLEKIAISGRYGDFVPGQLLHIDPKVGVEELATLLQLEHFPRTIEGLDIATLQGTDSVGGLVTFVDGVPFKSGYRRYRILRANRFDDYDMMREVVRRRFESFDPDQSVLPDLLVIDGGRGHLSIVMQELKRIHMNRFPVCSLAKKREEIFLPGNSDPIRTPKNSKALHLLQYVRDEAHRFAQGYHHLLRRKRTLPSSKPSD
jgi:excinuclease ABC subunit C